jgi:DNA-binding response OmpR family regulator
MNIGVLEDNPTICEYLKTALEMMGGHQISIHNYGASLLEKLFAEYRTSASLSYDLVLVDLSLPGGMSGQEVIAAIQQTIPRNTLPIIVLSAVSSEELDHVRTTFNVPVLRKPFKIQTLLQLIDMCGVKHTAIH